VSLPSPDNPFEASVDPRGYVPRAACDEVLDRLERHIRDGVPAILLRGPEGIGKSMLLAILHERMAELRQIAHVAVSPSPSMEISHRILDQLEVDFDEEPASTLVATARRYALSGRRVLVIIDQATHAPLASSRQLARAAARAGGDLCVLFAVTEEAGAEGFEREIRAETELATVRFDTPMNADETFDYVTRRLDQTIASKALRDRFDEAAFRYVIEGARGNPRLANELAYDALLRLERGEGLPLRAREPGAPVEAGARTPAPAHDEPRRPPGAATFDDAWPAEGSLGGGLLGAGPRRDPHELDAMRELFPPGFLRSGGDPTAPHAAPTDPGADAARPNDDAAVRGAEPARGGAQPRAGRVPIPADVAEPVAAITPDDASTGTADTARTTADAPPGLAGAARRAVDAGPRDRTLELSSVQLDSFRPGVAPGPAGTAPSSKRPKVWVAALVVAALAGGYLAGRIGRAPTSPAPLPAASPAPVARIPEPAPPVPVARIPEPMPPVPVARIPEPTPPVPVDRIPEPTPSVPIGSTTPAALPAPTPAISIDAGAVVADAEPAVASPSPAEAAPAEPALPAPSPTAAPKAARPAVPPAEPKAAPQPAPQPVTRAEPTFAATDSSARGPARSPGGSSVDAAPSNARSAASPIVVGARATAEPGAQASEFVRVRVRLEAGATLSIDGERVGVAPISDLIMEPGLHTFVAELPGGLQIEQLIQVTAETGIVEF